MMAMPHSGFVFLSMTKTGSTAIHQHFSRHAQVLARNPPRMKHMTAKTFTELIVPLLERYGRPRESYEVMCIAREPVDWVGSWWRYRARPAMEGKPKSTADLSFDEFAEQVVSGKVKLGSSANFVSDKDGKVIKEFKGNDRHMQNFIDVIRNRKTEELYGPIDEGMKVLAPARQFGRPVVPAFQVEARAQAIEEDKVVLQFQPEVHPVPVG